MFETGMSALVLKICSEYAKALGLNFPPCVQQEINAIAQYVDLHTVKDLKVEQNGSVVTITCFTEGEQEKVFTVTLPEINVDTLSALLKGSSSVVVDKSEDGRTLVVRLDQSVIDGINSKITKPETPSEESVVTMFPNGLFDTKPLSKIGGSGGKLYKHECVISNSRNTCNLTFFDYRSIPHTIASAAKSPRIGYILTLEATISGSSGNYLYTGMIDTFTEDGNFKAFSIPLKSIDTGGSISLTQYNTRLTHFTITSINDTVTEL